MQNFDDLDIEGRNPRLTEEEREKVTLDKSITEDYSYTLPG